MTPDFTASMVIALTELGDDHLILGHRLSECCGHAPMLEEDLSLPNMALDLLGQARNLYTFASSLENNGRNEDDFAYLRSIREYRNCLLVERPNTDFAHVILRQLYYTVFMRYFWGKTLVSTTDDTIAGIAGKAVKELKYHVRHCGEWTIRLGDGTSDSAARMQNAVDELHPYTDELFELSDGMKICCNASIFSRPESIRETWRRTIDDIFLQAGIEIPDISYPRFGGRSGNHSESFGHLLSELQYVQRAYPGMKW